MIYTVLAGDTFESIALKLYGVATGAARIKAANPQVLAAGLTPGAVLMVPEDNSLPPAIPQNVRSQGVNEVSITVDGSPFRFWTEMSLQLSLDTFDRFTLSAPWEPENQAFRDVFVPFTYKRTVINRGGVPLFTGTLVGTTPIFSVAARTVSVSGYALAGVWNDCTMPVSSFPLAFKDVNLQAIANTMAEPFGLLPVFEGGEDPAFPDSVDYTPTQKITTFLRGLAQQRNLVIGNDAAGMPVFRKAAAGTAQQTLTAGQQPVRKITPEFQPQQMYSHVSALAPTDWLGEGVQHTVPNPHMQGVFRPLVFTIPETDAAGAVVAAEAKAGRMFGNALAYTIELAGWENAAGEHWKANTLVRVLAPDVMIYSPTEFLIRSATLDRKENAETCILDLVPPGAFRGEIPEVLPWQ